MRDYRLPLNVRFHQQTQTNVVIPGHRVSDEPGIQGQPLRRLPLASGSRFRLRSSSFGGQAARPE
jgi:hypothetical protein